MQELALAACGRVAGTGFAMPAQISLRRSVLSPPQGRRTPRKPISSALRRWPLQKRRGQQCARHRPVFSVKSAEKRRGRQRRAGETQPAGSRAWIDRPRNTRGGGNHPTRSRASERHRCTCGGSPALLCAAAARGGYSTIHTKPYNPLAEVASPYTHNLTITAHTLRPPTAT